MHYIKLWYADHRTYTAVQSTVLVNPDNENFENSSVVKIDRETMRGYKLGVFRGVLDDSRIAKEIVFGTFRTHDREQCRDAAEHFLLP